MSNPNPMYDPEYSHPDDNSRDEDICSCCGGDGYIEIMGDGENFEWDVVATRACPECQHDY